MDLFKKIPVWLKNKYMLTATGFVVWLLFFDHNDIFMQMERRSELRDLEKGKNYYSEQVNALKKELSELKGDPASTEKAARERYMMKKDNEDLFIIEEK
ncbi:MAG: septum formation initiator family protein [Terrimonas sp.]|nr:septum formation initiator family protein [Terrimonas sp.]